MNDTSRRVSVPPQQIEEPLTPADRRDQRIGAAGSAPAGTGTFAEGEETLPERNLEERVLRRGSFASGVEELPEENAERRVHARGGYAVGGEAAPEQDAEARRHPGTFADSEPTA